MPQKNTIRKEKGIEICADLLFAGRTRREIVEEITKDYKVSVASIDNWLKAARPVVAERQASAKQIQDTVDKEAAEASAKRLNLTREAMLERLGEIIYSGKVKAKEKPVQVTEGGELVKEEEEETELIIVKAADVIRAVQVVNEMQGYNAPQKSEVDHTSGGQPIQQNTTLVIKPRNRREDSGD